MLDPASKKITTTFRVLRAGFVLSLLCLQAGIVDAETALGSAVDIQGSRHICEKGPPGTTSPWMADCIRGVSLVYPSVDRARRHEGKGLFRMVLDPKTGRVLEVTVVRSTGFKSLDQNSVAGLRKWRWRPGRWKEIELPVKFEMKK